MKKKYIFFIGMLQVLTGVLGICAMEGDFQEEKQLIMPSLKKLPLIVL